MLHGSPPNGAARVPSVAILGTDAILAVLPATPIQLMHACTAAGYAAAVPASWGDELVAAGCLRRLAQHENAPAILCACPYAADRLLESVSDLTRFLVPLVAPPVATARYVRALYGGGRVLITYIGACPAGRDPSIDTHLTPAQFLANLETLGISLALQPEVFESVLPPDRRRFRSLPGGAPAPEALWAEGGGRVLVELEGERYTAELAHRLLMREHALLDMAPRLGCVCSGATPDAAPQLGRAAIAAVEPPHAPGDVLDPGIPVDVDRPLPVPGARRPPADVHPTDTHPTATHPATHPADAQPTDAQPERADHGRPPDEAELAPAPPPATADVVRHPAPLSAARARAGHVPVARTSEGRVLPRAYAAHRHHARGGAIAAAPAPGAETPVEIPLTAAADVVRQDAARHDEAPLEAAPLEVAPLEVAPLEVAPLEAGAYEAAPPAATVAAGGDDADAAIALAGGPLGRGWLVRAPVARAPVAPVAHDPRPVVVGEKVVGLDLRWLTERPFVRHAESAVVRRSAVPAPPVIMPAPSSAARGGRRRRKKAEGRRSGAADARAVSQRRMPARRIALVAALALAAASGVGAALYYSADVGRRASARRPPAAGTTTPTAARIAPDTAPADARSPAARSSASPPAGDSLGGALSGAIAPPATRVPSPTVRSRPRRSRPAAATRDSAADTRSVLDSIRRELRLRQDRLDSIARAIQALPTTKPPET